MSFSNMQLTKNMSSHFINLLIHMASFATITPEEYKKLVDNEKKYLI